ncbi:MAG: HAD-IIB family hydrolase [Pseudohongiella sp.]|nr:HAD-IIB family hydrolase [Pseudohongiella sp.]
MELVVFDLDGTLLGADHRISDFTADTLKRLTANNIAYTVATGRNLHSAQEIIRGHGFLLPHIYINGVIVWDPGSESLSLGNFLSNVEAEHVIRAAIAENVTPFVHCVTEDHRHFIYHPPVQHDFEQRLVDMFFSRLVSNVLPLQQMPANSQITNISMLGTSPTISAIEMNISDEAHLVAYSGMAMENKNLKWMDIHHSQASKGNALRQLGTRLGASRILCFGDSDNDLSMFAMADEAYAPANAKDVVKAASTGVIGHHDEDGIAVFLRERFNL